MNALSYIDGHSAWKERVESVPEDYFSSHGGGQTADFQKGEEIRWPKVGVRFNTPLFSVGKADELKKMIKPVEVQVSSEEDYYIAASENLNLNGIGRSLSEAIDDLREQILYFSDYYRNMDWTEVAGDGERLKKIYETLIA